MRKEASGKLVYSPTDLVRFYASPFSSWMDRHHLEFPERFAPDKETADERLIAQVGEEHEQTVLKHYRDSAVDITEVAKDNPTSAASVTLSALSRKASVVYQAALSNEPFFGFADFVEINADGEYQVWDTKLARSPKPHYAIQLCCYSEMLASVLGCSLPEKFGLILGTQDRVEFRVGEFIHYYRLVKARFLAMQDAFTGDIADRPEPLPRADHGRWASHADQLFDQTDHLVRVAGISVGQIKKLRAAGISTMADLGTASGKTVPKLAGESFDKLVSQAELQCQTRSDRAALPGAPPRFVLLRQSGAVGIRLGLESLPPAHKADVYFDIEGYPLIPGGLEYLFGVCIHGDTPGQLSFKDWWAHSREEETIAFQGFVDWVFERWTNNPGMHIYHYASYEVSAVRKLSTRSDSRQDEVDELLKNEVFVDLYQTVRHGVRVGEDSYSIKTIERLYRAERSTEVATAVDSIVQYARWMGSGQPGEWQRSDILKGIRDYNEDDCRSTAELLLWLRKVAASTGIPVVELVPSAASPAPREKSPELIVREETAARLRARGDSISRVLADVIDFHRREEKPIWWRLFDRAKSTADVLRDDAGCIQGVRSTGTAVVDKRSLVQGYQFDPSQECKLAAGEKSKVMFTHLLDAKLTLTELDANAGTLKLKIGKNGFAEKFSGLFPETGALIPDEYVSAKSIQDALSVVAAGHLSGAVHKPVLALLDRVPPASLLQGENESVVDAAIRVTSSMAGGCLVMQGPPGTGKTYTASRVIHALVSAGKRVGVASNSHKAVVNLLQACGEAARAAGHSLNGIKVGGAQDAQFLSANPGVHHVKEAAAARDMYSGGVVGGTAWLFVLPEWEGALDFLFIDEAGQVSLANAIAMSRCASNLVLIGDQMQLEQPVQGSHPGDAGLSVLQYALKDVEVSKLDLPIFHAVVPNSYGLFLAESRRMHPSVCGFISESIYDGRLASHPDCARQKISARSARDGLISQESGIVFSSIEHDGNIQQSDEEVERVVAIYEELLGRDYTAGDGHTAPLGLQDFLFIAPYNAQVRALQAALPAGARVGSVDKFQGQEAPVCILSLCSSYGEYGSRGLAFILDRNRLNVAISRAQCLAVVVADPRIATATAGSIDEMQLINLFCKCIEQAADKQLR